MPKATSESKRLASLLPDIPRYLETRSMLLSGRCEVLGLEKSSSEPGFVARELAEGEEQIICVVGRPPSEAIREAVRRSRDAGVILSVPEDAPYVESVMPGWGATRATLHLLDKSPRLPRSVEGEVRPFRASDLDTVSGEVPQDLRSFLTEAIGRGSPVAAAFAGERPVSFCCASDETESLWDISIDTLEKYRRRGHAARCVSWMVDEMRKRGKEPVWCAEEINPSSMRLAAKLGFVPVDGLILFRPAS